MALEQEMLLWEMRNHDHFGEYLNKVDKAYRECLGEEEDEYGISSTPISYLKSVYALDGDARGVYKRVCAIIEDYDLEIAAFDIDGFLE